MGADFVVSYRVVHLVVDSYFNVNKRLSTTRWAKLYFPCRPSELKKENITK